GVPGHEGQFLSHHAAEAVVDEIAHDLVPLEVALALGGEVAGQRLQHTDLVLTAGRLLRGRSDAGVERQPDEPNHRPCNTGHASLSSRSIEGGLDGPLRASPLAGCADEASARSGTPTAHRKGAGACYSDTLLAFSGPPGESSPSVAAPSRPL